MDAKSSNRIFLILTAIILLAAYFRSSVFDRNDPYKCNALRSSGQWLDSHDTGRTKTLYSKWQPDGCMTRTYNAKKTARCIRSGGSDEAVFIGDSTVREFFWSAARKLDAKAAKAQQEKTDKHTDISFKAADATLTFYWDPFLNSSQVSRYMNVESTLKSKDDEPKPILVLGAGLWFSRHVERPVEAYKNAIDAVVAHRPVPNLDSKGKHRPVFIPVQPPFYENLDKDHKDSIRPDHVDHMNEYLFEVDEVHDVDVMTAYLHMVRGMPATAYDARALHVLPHVWDAQIDMLLNLKCNNDQRSYPFDGTCCYEYPLDLAQMILLVSGAVLSVVVGWIALQEWTGVGSTGFIASVRDRKPLLMPLLIMWAGLAYCYLADRTQLFDKVQKLYNAQDWWIFVAGIVIVGAATIRKSGTPQRPGQEKPANQDQPFLSRDQTDEWKGWMQILILAYHYTGGSKILWIYKIIRLLVASYLFMTGYGHAAYFYQKNDFSLKRVVAVNFRINLLSMLLPWMMSADYLFYYFAPLVTYWYAVIYLTMRVKSEWNQKLPLMLAKLAIACCITSFLHTQPALLDPAFRLINAVFGSQWDAKEWLFRCKLDQFIVYIGMLVSIMNIRMTKPPAPPPPPQSSMATTSHTKMGSSPHLRSSLYFVASGAALVVYAYISSTGTTKTSSNKLHTFISPLPILAFIHLRNSTRALRNHYSTAYAWIGKISLETFVLQYHIWLASDTKALLSLGLFGHGGMSNGHGMFGSGMGLARWADCIVLGAVFIWVSYKVANATGGVTTAATKMMFK